MAAYGHTHSAESSKGPCSLAQSLVRYCQRYTGFRYAAIDPKRPRYAKGIPRLCSFLFTVPNSPFAEIPIKKTYPNLFRKESGSDMNYMANPTEVDTIWGNRSGVRANNRG